MATTTGIAVNRKYTSIKTIKTPTISCTFLLIDRTGKIRYAEHNTIMAIEMNMVFLLLRFESMKELYRYLTVRSTKF